MRDGWTRPERREMYRRLAYVIEQHPYLSGLQTADHLDWLSKLAHWSLSFDEQPERGAEPNYDVELGYDSIADTAPNRNETVHG